MRKSFWHLLALGLLTACGGQLDESGQNKGALRGEEGGGGGAGSSSAGSFTQPPDGNPDHCPDGWPSDFHFNQITGLPLCPDFNSPAFWILSKSMPIEPMSQEPIKPVTQMTSLAGGGTACSYAAEEPLAPPFYPQYFGPGGPRAPLPAGPVAWPPPACNAPLGPVHVSPDAADRAAFLTRVWLRCSGSNSFLDGDGIAFFADGTYHTVFVGLDGELALTQSCYQNGLWGLDVPSYTEQLNLSTAVGTSYLLPQLTEGEHPRLSYETDFATASYVAYP